MSLQALIFVGLFSSSFLPIWTWSTEDDVDEIKSTVSSLLKIEIDYKNDRETKVAVGFGSCLDVMVPAMEAFEALNFTPPTLTHNHDYISSPEQLMETFGYFFQRGASAGRRAMDSGMFDQIFKAVLLLGASVELGGNAASMSRRFSRENTSTLLMADVMSKLSLPSVINDVNRLPEDVKVAGVTEKPEDVHIIFEYKKGDKWGQLETPRANRFILYWTSGNAQKSRFSKYLGELVRFRPNVLIVGGFRVLSQAVYEDGQSGMKHLERFLRHVPRETKTHVELSSFSRLEVLRSVVRGAVIRADSLGMNEQELPNLRKALEAELSGDEGSIAGGNDSSIVSESKPSLASVLGNIREVIRLLVVLQKRSNHHGEEDSTSPSCAMRDTSGCQSPVQCLKPVAIGRHISRIHVHTLPFQAIAIVKGHHLPNDGKNIEFHLKRWENSKAAAAKSALTAYRHTCANETIDPSDSTLIFKPRVSHPINSSHSVTFDPRDPVTCWVEGLGQMDEEAWSGLEMEVCVAPVPVCKRVVRTVGGGDNVSAAGLVPQA